MNVCANLKQLYSSLVVGLRVRRRDEREKKPLLQISAPFNFKKEPSLLPGLTEPEIFALREKAAASRIAILLDHSPSPPLSPCRSRSSRSSSLALAPSHEQERDFFSPSPAPPPIPLRSARRATSLMTARPVGIVEDGFGGGSGLFLSTSAVSLPVTGSSGTSTPVDLDGFGSGGGLRLVATTATATSPRPVSSRAGRKGWRSASGSPVRSPVRGYHVARGSA